MIPAAADHGARAGLALVGAHARAAVVSGTVTAEGKALSTLRAVAALAGIRVDPIVTDRGRRAWIVTRWHLTRQVDTLDELAGVLRQLGLKT